MAKYGTKAPKTVASAEEMVDSMITESARANAKPRRGVRQKARAAEQALDREVDPYWNTKTGSMKGRQAPDAGEPPAREPKTSGKAVGNRQRRDFSSKPKPPDALRAPFSPETEAAFQSWYAERAARLGLNMNPDAPSHQYDYRRAFEFGDEPNAEGHWTSRWKLPNHPRRFLNGIDTRE